MKRILAYNALVMLVGIILVELIFGNWLSKSRLNVMYVVKDVTIKYDMTGSYGPPGIQVIYKRDKWGLRGSYDDISKIDILTVGGSVTDQRDQTEGETWQDWIRRGFEKDGRKISVVNAGVDGQTSLGNLHDFINWFPEIPNLKMKYVLVYVGTNDFFVASGSEYDDFEPKRRFANIYRKSALYHIWKTAYGNWINYQRNNDHTHVAWVGGKLVKQSWDPDKITWVARSELGFSRIEQYRELLKPQLTVYEGRLLKLGELIHKTGALPIYVTQPNYAYKTVKGKVLGESTLFKVNGRDVNGVDFKYMMDAFHEITLKTCKDVGGICIDLAHELDLEGSDFYDGVHNTPAGVRKMGEYLHRKLKGAI